jgi:hypothetical protein
MAGQYVQGQAAYTQAKYEQSAARANEALANEQAKQQIDQTKTAAARAIVRRDSSKATRERQWPRTGSI